MIRCRRISFAISVLVIGPWFSIEEATSFSTEIVQWMKPWRIQQQQTQQRHSNAEKLLTFLPRRSNEKISAAALLARKNEQESFVEILGQNETIAGVASSSSGISIITTPDEKRRYGDNVLLITFQPYCHRPLGCTIEESLADVATAKTKSKDVFITKVVPGGFADQAGIQVGDVIIGATNNFGQLQTMMGEDIDKLKSVVSSRPDDETFQFKIARGTNVTEEHELALVQLIANPDFDNDSETEKGILDFIEGGYFDNGNKKRLQQSDEEPEEECNPFDDADCLVDNMYSMWADMEDYSPSDNKKSKNTVASNDTLTSSAPKPWSVRSSPSGTWVRDPKTGQMKNIDQA